MGPVEGGQLQVWPADWAGYRWREQTGGRLQVGPADDGPAIGGAIRQGQQTGPVICGASRLGTSYRWRQEMGASYRWGQQTGSQV